jgi:hypothetical protein
MPLTPVGLSAVLIPNLVGAGMLGTGLPQYALGVSNGVVLYNLQLKVITVDAGTLGAGVGLLPLLVPQPLLLSGLFAGFAAQALIGPMAPPLAIGLANGLSLGLVQGLVTTVHPTVGVGACVARFVGPSAVPSMIAGFASAGMVGPGATKKASAIGIALDIVFQAFTLPIPIVGPPSILPGGGAGFGTVV